MHSKLRSPCTRRLDGKTRARCTKGWTLALRTLRRQSASANQGQLIGRLLSSCFSMRLRRRSTSPAPTATASLVSGRMQVKPPFGLLPPSGGKST